MNLQHLTMLAIQSSIILTVFGFGLSTTGRDMLFLVRRPALLMRSLLAMFVVMPIVAILIVRSFTLLPSVEIALVALAISPVPPLLPVKERKAGGHSGYGLGLMALVSLLAIVTVPVGAQLLGRYFGHPFLMPSVAIAEVVVKMTLLPLVAGLILRAVAPGLAERIAVFVGRAAKVLLIAGVLTLLVGVLPAALSLARNGTIVAMAAFAAIGLAVGHWLGGRNADERTVLALSTASRHPAIALAVAKANFPNEPHLGATVLLYLLVLTVVGLPYVSRQRRAVSPPV